MKQFWISFFGAVMGLVTVFVLGFVFLIFLIGGLIASAVQAEQNSNTTHILGEQLILELDLRTARMDQTSQSPFAFAEPASISDLSLTFERAANDDKVRGLFIRANAFGMSPGQADEIRAGLARFAQSGKPVIAHAQGFEGPAIANYFAVTPASSLWLQDTASFSASGYLSEAVFLGGLVEQTGAQADYLQFYEYKSAANTYTQSDYTQAHREATVSWLGSLFDTALNAMAYDRGMPVERMQALIESAPYSAEEALQSQLVDQLGHVHEARQAMQDEAGASAQFIDINEYARLQSPADNTVGAVIALISGQGTITTGQGEAGFTGDDMIGSDRMTAAIESAIADSKVRAIILRVDSPGGSAIASDQIHDAILRARAAGKPVVVSMGAVAASGGYYIAAPADRIVASASTLTGSIGVVSGKLVLDGALQRLGINIEPISVGGEFTTALSSATPWTDSQRAAMEALAGDIYLDFTERVAQGRDLPLTRVQDIARGRVWTGAQALELGLIDRIGGLNEAVEEARALAKLTEDEPIRLVRYPRTPSPLEALRQLFGISAEAAETLTMVRRVLSRPEVQALINAEAELSAPGAQMHNGENVVVPIER